MIITDFTVMEMELVKFIFLKILMNLENVFDTIYGWHYFCNNHS